MDKVDIIKRLNKIIKEGTDGLAARGGIKNGTTTQQAPNKAQQKMDDVCCVLTLPVEYKKDIRGDQDMLSSAEIISINALIAYCSFSTGLSALVVKLCIQAHFKVESIDFIHAKYYPDVIEFLVDHDMRMFVN